MVPKPALFRLVGFALAERRPGFTAGFAPDLGRFFFALEPPRSLGGRAVDALRLRGDARLALA